jgi:hypothetical protein
MTLTANFSHIGELPMALRPSASTTKTRMTTLDFLFASKSRTDWLELSHEGGSDSSANRYGILEALAQQAGLSCHTSVLPNVRCDASFWMDSR